MRRPVVALDNGGTSEVVEHGKSGLLSKPNDIAGLADNIINLLQHAERRAQMGDYGRQRVLTQFSAQRMAADVANAYDWILGS